MRIPFGNICRRKTAPFKNTRGFTLLEILVAIFIFAVVMTTLYASFNAVISKNEAINEGRGVYEMARNCLDRMADDLAAVYVERPPLYEPPDFDDPEDPYRFVASEEIVGSESFSRLRFAADAHLPMGGEKTRGIAEIVYYLKESEAMDPGFALRRADTAYPYDASEYASYEESAPDPILCRGVKSFSLDFRDSEGEWQPEWDSENSRGKFATPGAVRIQLKVSDGSNSHAFETTVTLPVRREALEEGRKRP